MNGVTTPGSLPRIAGAGGAPAGMWTKPPYVTDELQFGQSRQGGA